MEIRHSTATRSITLTWSDYQPLLGCWKGDGIPAEPGLYRIRRRGRKDIDYVGQTGAGTMTLRRRLAMLKGIYGEPMPYNDPHTAGPALWALRQARGSEFEVAVVTVSGSTQWRKGLEALAISLYRQEHGKSPTVNFGRMPHGYRKSSGNNSKLVKAGKRFRGGPTTEQDDRHLPGIAPVAPLAGDAQALDWCGHDWSKWCAATIAKREIGITHSGLYRIRASGQTSLLYVGQGKVGARIDAHLKKIAKPNHEQGKIFGRADRLEVSWVLNDDWYDHQRLELENDLIAAHLLAVGEVPCAQFCG